MKTQRAPVTNGPLGTDRVLILRTRDSWIATRFGLSPCRMAGLIVEAGEHKYALSSLPQDALGRLAALMADQGITYRTG